MKLKLNFKISELLFGCLPLFHSFTFCWKGVWSIVGRVYEVSLDHLIFLVYYLLLIYYTVDDFVVIAC
jgi:hypothetical protein